MKPVGTFHDGIEIEIVRASLCNRRPCTVVNDFGRTHGGSCFQIIYSHALTATGDEISVYAITAQGIYGSLTYFMLGQFGNKVGLMSIMGTTYGYVGFPAPVINIKCVCLYKTRLSGCRQTEHDFSHRYYFSHTCILVIVSLGFYC